MTKRSSHLPTLRKRRSPSTGRTLAFSTLNGKTVSFGPWGAEAHAAFCAYLVDWIAAGRRRPRELGTETSGPDHAPAVLTLGGLCDRYLDHLEAMQDAGWKPRNLGQIRAALDVLEPGQFGEVEPPWLGEVEPPPSSTWKSDLMLG